MIHSFIKSFQLIQVTCPALVNTYYALNKTFPNAWIYLHKRNQLWKSLLNLPKLTLHHQILFPSLAPTTAQIAQRNAYFQASERRPDNVCPFQRVSGIGRAMISSTCRSFVIPWRGWGQASSLAPICSFTQSAFIRLHRNIPFLLKIQNSWWTDSRQ